MSSASSLNLKWKAPGQAGGTRALGGNAAFVWLQLVCLPLFPPHASPRLPPFMLKIKGSGTYEMLLRFPSLTIPRLLLQARRIDGHTCLLRMQRERKKILHKLIIGLFITAALRAQQQNCDKKSLSTSGQSKVVKKHRSLRSLSSTRRLLISHARR